MICAYPSIRMPFQLDHWKEAPKGQQPALLVKAMSRDEVQRHEALMNEAKSVGDSKTAWSKMWEAICVGVTGWKCVVGDDGKPLDWSEENFFSQLNELEMWQCAWRYPSVVRMVGDDRKN